MNIDPLNPEVADWGLWALMMVNDIPAATSWGRQQLKLHPYHPYILIGSSVTHYIQGDHETSIALAQKAVTISDRAPLSLIVLAQAYIASKKVALARPLIAEVQSLKEYNCPYETAVAFIQLKEINKAFEQLNKAVGYQSNCLIFIRNDPRLTPIRQDRRYEDILKKINLNDTAVSKFMQASIFK